MTNRLAIFTLAAAIAFAYGASPPDASSPDCAKTTGCEPIVSDTPQANGKACGQVTANECIMYHAVKCCCPNECRTATNPPPGKQQPAKPGKGKLGHGKKGCFHGDDSVQTAEYGVLPMRELATHRDAHVLTRNEQGNLEYSSVRYWLHSQPNIQAKFYILQTESGHRLSLSSEHLIYETDCQGGVGNAIYAKNVNVGRCLYVNEQNTLKESRVITKQHEIMTGIYSPITTTGNIVVNDVLASCFNYYENESLQKFIYNYMIGAQEMLESWLPTSVYQAAFNSQDGGILVGVPRIIFNFLQLSKVFVH